MKWDLSPQYYSGPNDKKIEDDLNRLESEVTKFADKYARLSKKQELSETMVFESIKNYESTQVLYYTLYVYIHLQFWEDMANAEVKSLYERVTKRLAKITPKLAFYELELAALPSEIIDIKLPAMTAAADYLRYLKDVRRKASFRLSEREEEIISIMRSSGIEAIKRAYVELTSAFKYQLCIDDEKRFVRRAELNKYLHGSDTQLRRDAYDELVRVHFEHKVLLVNFLSAAVEANLSESKLRGYSYPEEPKLVVEGVSKDVFDAVMGTVENNKKYFGEYLKLKKKHFGLDFARFADRYASPGETSNIAIEDAIEMIKSAFESFHPEFAEAANLFFSENRIHSDISEGKFGGALCGSSSPGRGGYILCNYNGTFADILTLAHETGHCLHHYFARNQTILNYHFPHTLAEIGSIFSELLVCEHLIANNNEDSTKNGFLMALLDKFLLNAGDEALYTRFQSTIYRRKESEALNADFLSKTWQKEVESMFGKEAIQTDLDRYGWITIGGLVRRPPFSSFPYTFSVLIALLLYRQLKQASSEEKGKFLKMLSNGAKYSANDALAEFGLDIHNPNTWQKGFDQAWELLGKL
ncbi:M3 family oligoendopeptidase [Bdellovibrionota bacterium]